MDEITETPMELSIAMDIAQCLSAAGSDGDDGAPPCLWLAQASPRLASWLEMRLDFDDIAYYPRGFGVIAPAVERLREEAQALLKQAGVASRMPSSARLSVPPPGAGHSEGCGTAPMRRSRTRMTYPRTGGVIARSHREIPL